jgi:hypothetical protein
MAIAGDIVIKLAADFAEFARNMDESSKKLEEFGASAQRTGDKVSSFISQIKSLVGGLGLAELVKQIGEYTDGLVKMEAATATSAATLGVSTDQFQALQFAATMSGQSVDAVTATFTKFNVSIGQAADGSKKQLDALNQLGVKILDSNGNLRSQADLLAEVAKKLLDIPPGAQRAALEVVLFGKAGQDLNAVLEQLKGGLGSLTDQAKAMGQVFPESVIKNAEDAERTWALAQRRFDVVVGSMLAMNAAATANTVSDWITAIGNALAYVGQQEGILDKLMALLRVINNAPGPLGVGQMGDPALKAALDAESTALDRLTTAQKRLNEMPAYIGNDDARRTDAINALTRAEENYAKAREQSSRALNQSGQLPVAPPMEPTVVRPGASNPPAKGGSGAKEQETIEAMIKRYADLQVAAQKTYDFIGTERGKSIEDLTREVKVQQTSDDIITKFEDKHGKISDDQRRRLEANVLAYEKQKDAAAALLKVETDAAATELRLGDGTAEYFKRLTELNKERDTGRVSALAYNNALVEAKQKEQDLSDQSKRTQNDLESLAAGFDQAARTYAKSTDMFATGGQIFNGITTAMTDSLDVLAGSSTKTWQQIALGFTQMLEKMALQAALSPVFKMISSGITNLLTPAATFPDVGSLIATLPLQGLAAGGPVSAGTPYVVGEKGPELFVPAGAGAIQPMGTGGGGVTVNLDMSQTQGASDPSSALAFGRKIKAAVVDVIQNEQRPGGTLYSRVTA